MDGGDRSRYPGWCQNLYVWRHFLRENGFCINSLWPGDAISWHRSGLTLVQVIACCLTAPSHYLNQCWSIINEILGHLQESGFIGNAKHVNPSISLKMRLLKTPAHLPGANELIVWCTQLILWNAGHISIYQIWSHRSFAIIVPKARVSYM